MEYPNLGRTIQDQVYDILKERILGMEPGYRPGDQVVISDICDETGVSQTPVKRALSRLEQDGLVEIRPRRGTFVGRLSYEDLFEVVEVLRGLELLSVELCRDSFPAESLDEMEKSVAGAERALEEGSPLDYGRIDKQFHMSIVKACGNRWLVDTYASLFVHTEVRVALYSRVEENVRSSLRDHKSITDVLRSFHKADVKNAISEHWSNAQQRLLDSDPLSSAQEQRNG